jgi:hypothetical protein
MIIQNRIAKEEFVEESRRKHGFVSRGNCVVHLDNDGSKYLFFTYDLCPEKGKRAYQPVHASSRVFR